MSDLTSRPRKKSGDGPRFLVHDLRPPFTDQERLLKSPNSELQVYLSQVNGRLYNAEHAATRIYTCRSWRTTHGATPSQELRWNDEIVRGETPLGTFGWMVGKELVEAIEAEFAKGEAVRVFSFDSDSDLCIEEVLVPLPHEWRLMDTIGPVFSHLGFKSWDLLARDAVIACPRSFPLTLKARLRAGASSATPSGERALTDEGDARWRRYNLPGLESITVKRDADGANEIRIKWPSLEPHLYGLGDQTQTDRSRAVLRQLYPGLYRED